VALVRPDHVAFGTAARNEGAPALLRELKRQLRPSSPEERSAQAHSADA
jgi:hypothetical protein